MLDARGRNLHLRMRRHGDFFDVFVECSAESLIALHFLLVELVLRQLEGPGLGEAVSGKNAPKNNTPESAQQPNSSAETDSNVVTPVQAEPDVMSDLLTLVSQPSS